MAEYRASLMSSQSASKRAALMQAFFSLTDIRLMRALALLDIFMFSTS
jgi:hypothetical protein